MGESTSDKSSENEAIKVGRPPPNVPSIFIFGNFEGSKSGKQEWREGNGGITEHLEVKTARNEEFSPYTWADLEQITPKVLTFSG